MLGGLLAAAGCQTLPERIDATAARQGMDRRVIAGEPFRHVVYERYGAGPIETLHVYIEGDGRPWRYGRWVADDPTPRNPYALALMARDPRPSVYLGRPCYFGLHRDGPCEERFWTSARYAPAVVDSMAAALERLLAERGQSATKLSKSVAGLSCGTVDSHGWLSPSLQGCIDGVSRKATRPRSWHQPEVVLVGYSGGGALAVLLADRVARVRGVVTVAGNLDIERWTVRRGYLPLDESLNPMTSARLRGIPHVHLVGAGDTVVDVDAVEAFVERHGGRYRVVEDFDHRCCWRERWPALLYDAAAWSTISGGSTRRADTP